MTTLFNSISVRNNHVRNRIGMSPMSMYASQSGHISDFEPIHYAARAMGGTGLVFTGTAAVLPEGRITPNDPGIWNDNFIDGLKRVAQSIKMFGATAGIQIGHAGRKASTTVPWHGGGPKQDGRSLTEKEGAWQTVGVTNAPYGADKSHTPQALDNESIFEIITAFGNAARRANEAGFDVLELHASHGYLMHQFYSPITNTRQDEWGGSFDNRVRLTLMIIDEVRKHWPLSKSLILRIAMDDFHNNGWNCDDAICLAKLAYLRGVDGFDLMSFGTIAPNGDVPWGAPFMQNHARQLRNALPNALIMFSAQSAPDMKTNPNAIAEIIDSGVADIVLLGRQLLADPNWPSKAANALGSEKVLLPNQYEHWLSGRLNTEYDLA